MGVEKVVIWAVCFVIFVSVLVACFDYILILNKKMDIDLVCRQYLWTAEMRGGLSQEERVALVDKLQAIGANNVKTMVPDRGDVLLGHAYTFRITGEFKVMKQLSIFKRQESFQTIIYEKEFIYKQVIN